jgi:hypothetical protein
MDTSAILGFQQPNAMQNLSGLLGVANGVQTLQQNQQKTQQGGIDLNERQNLQRFMSDPTNYTDQDGNVDFNRAIQGVMKVAPTTGLPVVQNLFTAQKQHTDAVSALNTLGDQDRTRIGGVLAAIPANAPPDVVKATADTLAKEYRGRLDPMVSLFKQGYDQAAKGGPEAVATYMQKAVRGVLPQETQQTMASPNLTAIPTNQGTQLVNTKQDVPGFPIGTVGKPFAPPNQFVQTPTGQIGVGNTATGKIEPPAAAAPGAAPVNFPSGENKETWTDLQGQRTAAQQAANGAPVMHDINRTIIQEASKGLNTGTLGSLTQRLASATGFRLDPTDKATDYNVLGKMLERSALTAAQSMGPHTNAGLEASVRANGSLDYTPQAIKKIAFLNDAIVSGSELYRDGLERAISQDPNGVFAKRNFDAQWSKVATPQVLRLKNAVDNGNQEEVQNILKEVGGRGSSGATKLHQQLTQMLKLTGR